MSGDGYPGYGNVGCGSSDPSCVLITPIYQDCGIGIIVGTRIEYFYVGYFPVCINYRTRFAWFKIRVDKIIVIGVLVASLKGDYWCLRIPASNC